MSEEDLRYLESVVRAQLFALRISGGMLLVAGLLISALLLGDVFSRLSRGEPFNDVALVVALLALGVASFGGWLIVRGRRPKAHALYALLTHDSARIETLRFVGLLHRPHSWVFLGVGGKEKQIVCPGEINGVAAFFCRVYPNARVVQTPDRRSQGPSEYAR